MTTTTTTATTTTTTYIVGVDGSETGARAARLARDQALAIGARVVLVHGIEWSRYEVITPSDAAERHRTRQQEMDDAARTILEPLEAIFTESGVPVESVVHHGHPAQILDSLARETGAAQIYVGRHGHSKLAVALFGSVAFSIAQTATVPVVIVP